MAYVYKFMHRIFVYEHSSDHLTLSFVNSGYVCDSAMQADLTGMVEEWRRTQGKITLCETRTVREADVYLGPSSPPYIPETTPSLGPLAIQEVDTAAAKEAEAA